MELTRLLLLFSTLAFIGGLLHAIMALRNGMWKENKWHLVPITSPETPLVSAREADSW
ncbi:MAG: hypothetical protein RL693_2659 [Verrucomicrobiota bacterium]|jgi:hypothetical protein